MTKIDPGVESILVGAEALIEDLGWCRATEAENQGGFPVDAMATGAVRWCLRGALKRASHGSTAFRSNRDRGQAFARARALVQAEIQRRAGDVSLIEFNDRASHSREVVAVIRAARERRR